MLAFLIGTLSSLESVEDPLRDDLLTLRSASVLYVTRGSFSSGLWSATEFFCDQGSFVIRAADALSVVELQAVSRSTVSMFCCLVSGMSGIVALREGSNCPREEQNCPCLSQPLCKMSASVFCTYVLRKKSRLMGTGWTEQHVEQVESE
eukprot:Plantae.Rhodophyta-Palmaria_palmata.ctg3743.p1 GENE.Plantae.Rhodophyta-Palmaria_palmata.ctg3743~~Plantae.Rhodophyta-Palmaria_palmata.ctg3743.p1  ORF type:complete len:149 (-),score=21.29 Plantae.Rhodophyta-Palmaria_palmata.ctg3743:453-899(-)